MATTPKPPSPHTRLSSFCKTLLLVLVTFLTTCQFTNIERNGGGGVECVTYPDFKGQVVEFVMWDLMYYAIRPSIERWERLTGGNVSVSPFTIDALYAETDRDMKSTQRYDVAMTAAAWVADWVTEDRLIDVAERIRIDGELLDWFDIFGFTRNFGSKLFDTTMNVPIDADVLIGFYRTDLAQNMSLPEPETWEDVFNFASHFQGKDLNGDGEADYGLCVDTQAGGQGLGYYFFFGVVASYLQSLGTSQGVFFDTETMEPLTTSEGFAEALRMYKKLTTVSKYGLTGKHQIFTEVNHDFMTGRCAIAYSFPNFGSFLLNEDSILRKNLIRAKVTPLFGSKQVYDRNHKKMVACDETICPYAVNGVNRALYSPGHLVLLFPQTGRNIDAAWHLASFLSARDSSQDFITYTAGTVLDPFRMKHLKNISIYIEKGLHPSAAYVVQNFFDVIWQSYNSPNIAVDMKLKGTFEYLGLGGTSSLELFRAQFVEGKLTVEEMMSSLTKAWDSITNKYGRLSQLNYYRRSLQLDVIDGINERTVIDLSGARIGMYVVSAVTCASLLILIIWVALKYKHPVIKSAGAQFIVLIQLAALIGCTSLFLWTAEPTASICYAKVIMSHVAAVVVLGCISLKNHRLYRVVRDAAKLSVTPPTTLTVLGYLAILLALDGVLLAIWAWLSDIKTDWVVTSTTPTQTVVWECVYKHETEFSIVLFLFLVPFLLFSALVAFLTRRLKIEYNESKILTIIVYSAIISMAVLVPIIYFIDDRHAQLIIQVVGGSIVLLVTFGTFFGSKIFHMFNHQVENSADTMTTMKSNRMSSVIGSPTVQTFN